MAVWLEGGGGGEGLEHVHCKSISLHNLPLYNYTCTSAEMTSSRSVQY